MPVQVFFIEEKTFMIAKMVVCEYGFLGGFLR
jgi:hypothetical protein